MFKITARTVLELGAELISSDIIAFYELIKNGFDARTRTGVEIRFNVVLRRNSFHRIRARAIAEEADFKALTKEALDALEPAAPPTLLSEARAHLKHATSLDSLVSALDAIDAANTIEVSDSGTGMSLSDLTDCFLVIGTPSRKREVDAALRNGATKSPYLGEKGIGRLSAMRLGSRLHVESARRDDAALNLLDIEWSAFENLDAMLDEIAVAPKQGGPKPSKTWSGTRLVIGGLAEDWSEARLREMAEYAFARLTDPFLDQKLRPRVVLFWNGERLSIPWMSSELLDHAHARVSGEYTIADGVPELRCTLEALDLNFEHPKETETAVVSLPDLTSAIIGVSGALPDSALVSVGPFSFEAHWYNRRRLGAIDGIGEMKTVRSLQERWSGIMLFRDGFRVFPYGEDEDDWLALDRKALRRSSYTLNKTQFVGRVRISRADNPQLIDQTNREGLRETPEQQVLLLVMQYVIQDQLFRFMKNVEKQYKSQRIDLEEARTDIATLETRAKTALKRLRKLALPSGAPVIEELQQALFEFSEFAEQARVRISEVEQESRQLIDMAGVGLMVEVVAHELARASEHALENLEALRTEGVPEEIRGRLASLRAQLKSISKRVRVLDPLSVAARQRKELFSLDELVRDVLDSHKEQFERHSITLSFDGPAKPIFVRAVKGMIVQILENLIANAKYWLQARADREKAFSPSIAIALHDKPPTVVFEDNGPGIAPDNAEKVFRPFFSLKEKAKRRGLGLFIARECAEFNGGTLVLDTHTDSQTGRLHRFTLELPQ